MGGNIVKKLGTGDMNIPSIARRFEDLLGIDSVDISYHLFINPSQAACFVSRNVETKKAMDKLSYGANEIYRDILDDLTNILDDMDIGDRYSLTREQIFNQ